MPDRRRSPRQRTFKGGSITLPIGIVDCVVRNISEAGALLEFKSPALIPDDFILVIRPEHTRRQCHVIWRQSLRLGVQFV
jgi:PilZ domain